MNIRTLALIAFTTTSSMSVTAMPAAEQPRVSVVLSQKPPIPNIAGKNFVASVVDYRPGAK